MKKLVYNVFHKTNSVLHIARNGDVEYQIENKKDDIFFSAKIFIKDSCYKGNPYCYSFAEADDYIDKQRKLLIKMLIKDDYVETETREDYNPINGFTL